MVKKLMPSMKKTITKVRGINRNVGTLDGIPIIDATKSIKLAITAADIKAARSKAPDLCAAALACKRQFRATEARVYLSRTYVRTNGKWVRYFTPHSLKQEIIALDRGGTFEPGEFKLYRPHPSVLSGASGQGGNHGKKKKPTQAGKGHTPTPNVRPSVDHDH